MDLYRSITPRNAGRYEQTLHGTLIVRNLPANGTTIRVTINFDTSYSAQCRGEIAWLTPEGFKTLLALHAHDIPAVQHWYSLDAPGQGRFLRHGAAFENMLNESLDSLASLGFKIAGA